MKVLKFAISLIVTVTLIYCLDRSWVIGGNRLPPLGKFLDPFHGFWQNIEADDHTFPAEIDIPGLKDKVTIVFDSLQVPHIFATNDEDLYTAQGYVTALHRLWQLEFQAFAGEGSLSKIIGGATLDYDRMQRRIGMGWGAEHALKEIEKNPTSKLAADALTKGINAYINSIDYKQLPIEYKLMDYSPEPWTNFKSAMVVMNFNKTLSFAEKDMEMTNALKLFGIKWIDVLYPDDERVGEPIVDTPGKWKFNPIKIDSVEFALPTELISIKKVEKGNPKIGSNNWAVSGEKTKTGFPILCNDMHLELNLPSLWYMIHLNAPGINSMGVSSPGGPGVVVGFNDSIAWGPTNSQRDLVDWYQIQFKDQAKKEYLLDGKWIASQVRLEKISVRDKEEFIDTVFYTHWGPVVYDETFHGDDNRKSFAFRWIAHEAGDEFELLQILNRAKNFDDYLKAMDQHDSPAQNFAFASVSGDIGIKVQGKFPVRRKNEGKFVLDGSKSSSGWQAFIPYDQNPWVKNPERGFVRSANQYPVDMTYPYYITAQSFEGYRHRRIAQVLENDTSITVEDMMSLQNDNFNLKASESVPHFLKSLNKEALNDKEKKVFEILESWDFFNDTDSKAACYYDAWWNAFNAFTWDEVISDKKTELSLPTTFVTIRLMKEMPALEFFDNKETNETEDAPKIIQSAFSYAIKKIDTWESENKKEALWGDYKNTLVRHLSRLQPFSQHVRVGGDDDIVNAASKRNGPSWRQIVSLEPSGVKAWGVYPGGQSGNPGSKYYNNMIDEWEKGKYHELNLATRPEQVESLFTIHLNPSEK